MRTDDTTVARPPTHVRVDVTVRYPRMVDPVRGADEEMTVVTITELAADSGAVVVEPPGTHSSLSFRGRFPFGIDQWALVPFDVPAGVRRITVSTSHDRFSLAGVARNVLDLGIFGPAGGDLGNAEGFRGWSGGARDGFTLSAADATPGYLAGPITPGQWALAFGPVVLNPFGMGWQADILLEYGPPASPTSRVEALPTVAEGRGLDWYRGDLHLHTVHSDGRHEPQSLAATARAAGLDFIVSTDHNTNSANRAWGGCRTDGLLVIGGEEVTTRHGHWLAVGLAQDGWLDWRYAPRDGVFAGYAAAVRAAGGIVVAAHPAVPLPGSAWEFGYRDVDAIEVWNGAWNLDDEISLRHWHRLLRGGRRIAAVGGSDSHGSHQAVGLPQTVARATGLSTAAVIEALLRGRSYIAESSAVSVELTASCRVAGDTATAAIGEALPVPPADQVTVDAEVRGAPGTTVALITAAGCVARIAVDDSGTGRLRFTDTGARARFARVEVRRPVRRRLSSMVALTNPVWLEDASLPRQHRVCG